MSAAPSQVTAEDIGRRVLKLIDGLRSAADLAPDRIEHATGIPVEFNAEDRNVYGFGGPLGDGWSYSLVSTPEKLGEKPRSLRFSFDAAAGSHPDPAAVCKPDFDHYAQALKAAGYAAQPMQAYPGSDAWYFTRGDIAVTAYAAAAGAAPATPQACLSKLVISAAA